MQKDEGNNEELYKNNQKFYMLSSAIEVTCEN